jgi:hypothetical protein
MLEIEQRELGLAEALFGSTPLLGIEVGRQLDQVHEGRFDGH